MAFDNSVNQERFKVAYPFNLLDCTGPARVRAQHRQKNREALGLTSRLPLGSIGGPVSENEKRCSLHLRSAQYMRVTRKPYSN